VARKDYELFKATLRRIYSVSQEEDGSIRVEFLPENMKPPPISKLGVTIENGRKKASFSLTKKNCFRFLNPQQLAIQLINLPFSPRKVEFYVFKGLDPSPKNDLIMFRKFSVTLG